MTKAEYIDFIRNSLPQEDETDKFHPAQVEAAINLAVNTVFYELYEKNPKAMAKAMERYSIIVYTTVGTPIIPTLNANTGRYETSLTFDIVDLPKKAGGVLEVTELTNSTTKYVPVSTMEGEQLKGSESSLPNNVIGYSMSGPRTIEFWNMAVATVPSKPVLRVIKQFKSRTLTENVLLPYGQDERIIELVRQYLGVIPPKDLVNDNADMITNG